MGHPHCSGQQCLGLTALVGKNFFLASNLNLPFYFTLLLLSPHSLFLLLLFSLKHAHEKKEKYYVLCVASASQKMILTGGKEGEKIQKLPIAAHAHGNKMWST